MGGSLLALEDLHRRKKISTRHNRHEDDIVKTLKKAANGIFAKNENADFEIIVPQPDSAIKKETPQPSSEGGNKPRKTRRTKAEKQHLFGGKLFLEKGIVNNLYCDIDDTYNFYLDNQDTLSDTYSGIIRMTLRLLAEAAGNDENLKMDKYLRKYFDAGKKMLTLNEKTFISNQSVSENKLVQLLQTGAHNYIDSTNMDQTRAVSIVLGKILTLSHGKHQLTP
ncbi:hypothetical protein LF599_16910 [Pseudodesulfovibrio thermohalotolerans]|uniref:hypothetical protein n=1 Tax=Pseudodesulfovibrio thermohalotolerans TaxID=2880651 RepID=UPI002442D635|nr:hypothetical protein [Pseudodesulfovibrio thermohalotolerans]WFS62319.1 hypothetical protein LF599_16910 [Pseudodesulfovibrio thermohalotolerans]